MSDTASEDCDFVLRRCLYRIAADDAAIGAMVHLDRAGAIRAAEAASRRWRRGQLLSPIDGMPVAIKANIAVAGWPWTAGIEAYADRRAAEDAACVARLRAAGAVLIGLTNMDEGALGAVTDNRWSGRTHNPHAHGFTAGGSSGGSAAAVAAGFCVAALGTDTIGSVRIPASYCGVTGHKPRRGSIPIAGVAPLSPTLDQIGILAATARTCRLVGEVAMGDGAIAPVPLAGLSIATPDREAATVDPEIAAAFDAMLAVLEERGVRVQALPAGALPFARIQRLLLIVAEVEGAAVHRVALERRPEGFSPGFAAMLAWGAGPGAARYEAALAELAAIAAGVRAALAGIDALLCPTTPHTAFAFDGAVPPDQAVFAGLAACLGDPATTFPIGRSAAGLPLSAQAMARSDAISLALAEALTIAQPVGAAPGRPTGAPRPLRL